MKLYHGSSGGEPDTHKLPGAHSESNDVGKVQSLDKVVFCWY